MILKQLLKALVLKHLERNDKQGQNKQDDVDSHFNARERNRGQYCIRTAYGAVL